MALRAWVELGLAPLGDRRMRKSWATMGGGSTFLAVQPANATVSAGAAV
jgi:hypothetical protein